MHTAFSREDPSKKVYVTHLLKEQSENIWRILGQENGHLYVCGSVTLKDTRKNIFFFTQLFFFCLVTEMQETWLAMFMIS